MIIKNKHRIITIGIFIVIILCISFLCVILPSVKDTESKEEIQQIKAIETPTDYGMIIDYYDNCGNIYKLNGIYSSVHKFINYEGLVVEERYYFNGSPVTSVYGEYGKRYGYDALNQLVEITYIDNTGNPMIASPGYATIKRNYYNNGNLKEELFYDLDGNPVQLSTGPYGYRYIKGIAFELNESGQIIITLDIMMKFLPYGLIIFGLMFSLIIICSPIRIQKKLFILYIVIIILLTLIREPNDVSKYSFPMWSYRQFFTNYNLRIEILNNIWLFIPLGAGIRSLLRKPYFLFIPFLFSMSIEAAQYFFGLGLCELDDIFSNTLGGCIGFLMAYEIESIISWIRGKREKGLSVGAKDM